MECQQSIAVTCKMPWEASVSTYKMVVAPRGDRMVNLFQKPFIARPAIRVLHDVVILQGTVRTDFPQ
jgi:hypothetical protein